MAATQEKEQVVEPPPPPTTGDLGKQPEPTAPATNGLNGQPATEKGQKPDKKDGAEDKTNDEKRDGKGDGEKDGKKDKGPAGGYDATPIPKKEPGWTVKFTFIKATNLPMADINSLSSDPYVLAQLNTGLPQRHKEDPALRYRSQTIRRSTDPTWNAEWIVAHVPSSGFKMKVRLYDEDPADHDDRLGNVHVNVDHLDDKWPGIHEQAFKIKKRMGSKRAYAIRAFATCFRFAHHMHGELFVSVEVLGRSNDDNGGRAYTVGPAWWIKHYSPLLGRITGIKDEDHDGDEKTKEGEQTTGDANAEGKSKKKANRYNFQANQMQLPGPVPADLYHRYVEFKPFVKGMFTDKGLRGFLLNKALHHQHARVYNFDRSTVWGLLPQEDPEAASKRFLELTHYDQGGRIFTYVITLDSIFRFTETGKEFGIDMLSKHTMHSDVSIYIAFSGEFFIRRYRGHNSNKESASPDRQETSRAPDPTRPVVGGDATADENPAKRAGEGGIVDPETPIAHETGKDDISTDPSYYELVIDNDSGTYRPNAEMLPLLRTFLQRCFPGLHVRVLDCQKDAEKMGKMKEQQREFKKKAQGGQTVMYTQGDGSGSTSSLSSSDDEAVGRAEGEPRLRDTIKHDARLRTKGKVKHWKEWDPRKERPGVAGETGEEKVQKDNVPDEKSQGASNEGTSSKDEGKHDGKDSKKKDGKDEKDGGEEKKDDGPSTQQKVREQDKEFERKGTVDNQGQGVGAAGQAPTAPAPDDPQAQSEKREGEQ